MSTSAHIDYETYCDLNFKKVGAYRYARHPSCEVLIVRYWLPGMRLTQMPREWLPRTQPLPEDLREYLEGDGTVTAHNAQFERVITKYVLRRQCKGFPKVADTRWGCTAVRAAAAGLPRSLEGALKAMGSTVQKDTEGQKLIKLFCSPRKPTKANKAVRIYPEDNPEAFKRFSQYCATDVLGEMSLDGMLPELHQRQRRLFLLDMAMNDRGLPIDVPLVRKALDVVQALEEDIAARVHKLSGGLRATQVAKMLQMFADRGLELENMQAATVRETLKDKTLDRTTRALLQLRVEAGKASTKKLVSMLACADPDEYVVQGSFLLFGAHTGRYSGRLIQPQNFIRGLLKRHQRDCVFDLLDMADPRLFRMLYDWPIDIISQCMRGFIMAPDGFEFAVVDYSAIEARVLAWVAGEESQLQAFRNGTDVYKLMAVKLYRLNDVSEVDDEQRRIAKNLVLGCGYQLGGPKFVDYAAKAGVVISETFAKRAVRAYRDAVPAIVKSWKKVETLVANAINDPDNMYEGLKCRFYIDDQWLCIELPSSRCIRYFKPRALRTERWGKPAWSISYMSEFKGRLLRETTYGGKLIENIVQAIAFDIMSEGMFNCEANRYPVCGTVHDELITLRRRGTTNVKELETTVCRMPKVYAGLPLDAKGFVCVRYEKN